MTPEVDTSVSIGGNAAGSADHVTTTTAYYINAGLPFRVTDADQKVVEFGYEPSTAGWRRSREVTPTGVTMGYV